MMCNRREMIAPLVIFFQVAENDSVSGGPVITIGNEKSPFLSSQCCPGMRPNKDQMPISGGAIAGWTGLRIYMMQPGLGGWRHQRLRKTTGNDPHLQQYRRHPYYRPVREFNRGERDTAGPGGSGGAAIAKGREAGAC